MDKQTTTQQLDLRLGQAQVSMPSSFNIGDLVNFRIAFKPKADFPQGDRLKYIVGAPAGLTNPETGSDVKVGYIIFDSLDEKVVNAQLRACDFNDPEVTVYLLYDERIIGGVRFPIERGDAKNYEVRTPVVLDIPPEGIIL